MERHLSTILWGVRPWSGGLEHSWVSLSGVQRVMWCTVFAVLIDLLLWLIGRSRTAVICQFPVANAEWKGWSLVHGTTRIMTGLSSETRQAITRSRTIVRRRYGYARLGVFIYHDRVVSGDNLRCYTMAIFSAE